MNRRRKKLENNSRTMRSLVWVWINWMRGLIDGGSHFRMKIILGTILIWFLVFHVCVPECSRNGSGVCPYLWVQEKFAWFRQSIQNAGLCTQNGLLNSWDNFLENLPSISSETCVICSSEIPATDVYCDWPFLGCSCCVSLATAANFRLFLNVAIFWREKCYSVLKTESVFIC